MSGRLIVLEGPDGVGKTTLSKLLVGKLKEAGTKSVYISFPGSEPGTVGELIHQLHHDPARFGITSFSESAKQALHIAAHIETILSRIKPAIEAGELVILDRYWWSTWVYGIQQEISVELLRHLIEAEKVAWGEIKPHACILLRRKYSLKNEVSSEAWQSLLKLYVETADVEAGTIIDNDDLQLTLGKLLQIATENWPSTTDAQPTLGFDETAEHQPVQLLAPVFWKQLSPAKPTPVLESYWRFAVKRQEIFFSRLSGNLAPWSDDPILQKYKFTNAYRASDRVSQYLISNVIYNQSFSKREEDVILRILLFKIFNKIETWDLLVENLGDIRWKSFDLERINEILTKAMRAQQKIYSAAYIMPPGGTTFGFPSKHTNHLALINLMMGEELPRRLSKCQRMQQAYELLRSYPTIGDFLAYQFVTDINYSEVTDFTEMEFVVPGPGAKDGLHKCFSSKGGLSDPELIRLLADLQEEQFASIGLTFKNLWGRPLQLIDCQNLFCEVDKYSRVAHPEAKGLSGRTRIKQVFSPKKALLKVWYPPKWKINDSIEPHTNVPSIGKDVCRFNSHLVH